MQEREMLHLGVPEARRGLVPGLNGLRALSIMIVLVGHLVVPKGAEGLSSLGVFIFFAISGFLVTRLFFVEIKRDGSVNIPSFFWRRILRLYPVVIVYMLCATIVAWIYDQPTPAIEYASVFFYFVNYLRSWQDFHGLAPTILPVGTLWSLSVEEHFYLIAPFAILLLRGNARRMMVFALVASVVPFLLRCLYLMLWPQLLDTEIIYRLSEARFDSIACGVALACLCEYERARTYIKAVSGYPALALGIAMLLLTYVVRDPMFKDTFRYTLRNLFSVILIAHVVFYQRDNILQRLSNWSFADWVGRISYSLYIWHGMALWYGQLNGLPRSPVIGLAMIAATFVMAIVSYYWVELPFLKLKGALHGRRGFPPSQAKPLAVKAP